MTEETEYKEDSTKGKSILQPMNYKGDVNAQAWIDSRVLATLSNWLERDGNRTKYLSDCVKRPLIALVEYLVNAGQVEMIEDTGKARRLLIARYGVELNRGNKGRKNELHNRIVSDKRAVLKENDHRFNDVERPVDYKKDDPRAAELARQAEGKYKEMFGDRQQTVGEVLELAKNDPNVKFNSASVREGMTEEEFEERQRLANEAIEQAENSDETLEYLKGHTKDN